MKTSMITNFAYLHKVRVHPVGKGLLLNTLILTYAESKYMILPHQQEVLMDVQVWWGPTKTTM